MRTRRLLPLLLVAAPLGAQSAPLRPAPSPLFGSHPLPAVAGDSAAYQGPSVAEGAVMGGLGGLLAGLVLSRIVEAQSSCHCEDPGLGRAVSYGLTGLVVGAVVGGAMAGSKEPAHH